MKSEKSRATFVEIRDGVYHLDSPRTRGSKVYLIRGNRKNMLVDAGLPADFEFLEKALHGLGLTVHDVHIIVLTHEHMDHIGTVPYFPMTTTIAAHSKAANKIILNDEFVMMNKVFAEKSAYFHIDIHLHHGTVFDLGGIVLNTLHTPGHCSGAICLYDADAQFLFTGDTIFANGTLGGIFPSGNISDYVDTLKLLRSLKIGEFYPGHGKISKKPSEDIEKAIKGSMNLLNDTRLLHDSLNTQSEFGVIMKAVSSYAKRV